MVLRMTQQYVRAVQTQLQTYVKSLRKNSSRIVDFCSFIRRLLEGCRKKQSEI